MTSVELFDLAQRLYAERSHRPVRRLAYSVFTARPTTLAIRARLRKGRVEVTVAAVDGSAERATDRDALALLAAHGATITAPAFTTLLTDDTATVAVLELLARRHAKDADETVRAAAALCGWWDERADHPGTAAVVQLVTASRATLMLGTAPAADANPAAWRRWLGVADPGCPGLHAWAGLLSTAPLLPRLEATHHDDQRSYDRARALAEAGGDWTRPDTPLSAALGLRSRCDAADIWEAALLDDPLWRQRAVFSGHVVSGTVESVGTPGARSVLTVTCDRIESRLREGSSVEGWTGALDSVPDRRFHAEVRATSIAPTGQLVLELTGVGGKASPAIGDHVCLIPEPPNVHQQGAGRSTLFRRYNRRSWLSTGQAPPPPSRREVPLALLIAAADDGEADADQPE
ncbi:hypothetical protein [Nocardia sp. IFM 10818]